MNATILRLAAQAMLGRRRGLLMLILPVALVGLALVVRLLTDPGVGYVEIVGDLGMRLALPLVALLAATSVLGPEIDDGSVVYLLAKPVNRYTIAVSKYAAALAATVVFGALPLLAAGLVIDIGTPASALGYLVGGVVAGATYSGIFLALCALTRHAVVVGLLFAFLWESVLGNLFTGIVRLSPGSWGERVTQAIAPDLGLNLDLSLPYALIASAVVSAFGVWYAGRRLSGFSLTGED